jgi:hypothetical protein
MHPSFQSGPNMNDQLAAPVEEVGKRLPAVGRAEDVLLVDLHPGQRAPLGGDQVAHAGERLLVPEMRLPCGQPFLLRHNSVLHVRLP